MTAAEVVVSVAEVDVRVVLLHPATVKPVAMSANTIVFFIGGLSCLTTDRAGFVRFKKRLATKNFRRAMGHKSEPRAEIFSSAVLPIVRHRNDEASPAEQNFRRAGAG